MTSPPRSQAVDRLVSLLDRYLSGERSRPLVAEIEGVLIEHFSEEPWFDEVSEELAMYSPGDPQPPYRNDEDLEAVLTRLRRRRM